MSILEEILRKFGTLFEMFLLTEICVWKGYVILMDLRMMHIGLWELYKVCSLFGGEI